MVGVGCREAVVINDWCITEMRNSDVVFLFCNCRYVSSPHSLI